MADEDLLTLEDWENHLAELQREMVARVGATNVQIGSLNVDQTGSADELLKQIAFAEDMINRMGGGVAATANARATEADGSSY